MSIGDALKFEKSWVGDIWKGIKRDPKRLVLGVDPLSTKAWNFVLGRDDKPVVGHFGGPTKESYQNAQAKGIDTGTASTLHGIAKGVASIYGGYGAANGLINAGAAAGSSSSFIPAAEGSSGASAAPSASGGSGLFNMDWQNPQTYTRFAGMGQGQGQQQQRPQANPWLEELRRQEEERQQQEKLRQQLALMLAAQNGQTQVLS